MARGVWMSVSGDVDFDVITAGANDILDGKVTIDEEGEPLTGTMPNQGAVSQVLGINGSYSIPAGYHNGSGKVTQSIPVQGGSTIIPGTTNKTAVAAGRYINGNVIVAGSSNLIASCIKKGVNIFGVTGTFEGYVPTASDLYLRGNNVANVSIISKYDYRFESGSIYMLSQVGNNVYPWTIAPRIVVQKDLTGFNYVNVEYYISSAIVTQSSEGLICISITNSSSGPTSSTGTPPSPDTYGAKKNLAAGASGTLSVNISAINAIRWIRVHIGMCEAYIYRIWLS